MVFRNFNEIARKFQKPEFLCQVDFLSLNMYFKITSTFIERFITIGKDIKESRIKK